MHLTRLDLWTKRLVGESLRELGGRSGPSALPPSLIGALAERVAEVLSASTPSTAEIDGDEALADELALTVYLTAATVAGAPRVPYADLASLRESFSRTLQELAAEAAAPATKEVER